MVKIHSDPNVEALRQDQAKKAKEPNQAFGAVLGEELGKAQGQEAVPTAAPTIATPPLLGVQAVAPVEEVQADQEAVDQINSLLGKWDSYAAHLGSVTGDATVKDADRMLDDIAKDVDDLKAMPGLAENHPELKSMVDEIEVMAVTERIKLNRGDYH